jgi:hypothetical protein
VCGVTGKCSLVDGGDAGPHVGSYVYSSRTADNQSHGGPDVDAKGQRGPHRPVQVAQTLRRCGQRPARLRVAGAQITRYLFVSRVMT